MARDAEFHVVRELGRGGMGVVDLVERRGPEGKVERFARKSILTHVREPLRAKERLLQEARVAALLFHPNVVRLVDAGETDGMPWLLFEYVQGVTLHALTADLAERGETMPPALAAHVAAEIAAGLHAAHTLRDVRGEPLGLVHRDVSPHNVMIGQDGAVKLLDFGVARLDRDRGLSRTGEVHGKVAYMAPEQALGDVVSARADLYALGAVLYECVAGRPMWATDRELEILRAMAKGEAPPTLRDTQPGSLADVQAELVAFDPEARPASAEAVRARLREVAAEDGPRELARLVARMAAHAEAPATTGRRRGSRAFVAVVFVAAFGVVAGAAAIARSKPARLPPAVADVPVRPLAPVPTLPAVSAAMPATASSPAPERVVTKAAPATTAAPLRAASTGKPARTTEAKPERPAAPTASANAPKPPPVDDHPF